MTKAAPTAADASQPDHSRNLRPKARLRIAPASGSAGTSQMAFSTRRSPSRLPSQEVRVVDVGAPAPPEDRDDDRESDDDLRRGDHHREERERLPGQVPVLLRERDEREVHRVQLEFHRHEDHEGVPAQEDARSADREQDPGEHQEIADRRHGTRSGSSTRGSSGGLPPASSSSCSSAIGSEGSPRAVRPAITIAAIAATISSTDVTSNGKKYRTKRTLASACVLPPPFAAKVADPVPEKPTPIRTAKKISAATRRANRTPRGRCAGRRSIRLSLRSTPRSMITNRNSTMIAPA